MKEARAEVSSLAQGPGQGETARVLTQVICLLVHAFCAPLNFFLLKELVLPAAVGWTADAESK